MKHLVVVGGGTGGTILANRARAALADDWSISVIDPEIEHLYQPGLLFVPFGGAKELLRPRASTFAGGVRWVRAEVAGLDPARKQVDLVGGEHVPYDLAVVASGATPRPDRTKALGPSGFGGRVHHFYDLAGARALAKAIADFEGGRFVVALAEPPAKCAAAPLEFLFLAEEHLTRRGMRGKVEIASVLPAFADLDVGRGGSRLGELFAHKRIEVDDAAALASVDEVAGIARTSAGREIPFDLLVTVPAHGGAGWVGASGLGDASGFVPTDPRTLRASGLDDVYVVGDASDIPTAKAGAVAHFEAEVLAANLVAIAAGHPPDDLFLHEDVEWPPPRGPARGCVPAALVPHGTASHWGKLAFQWMYWNTLLPGSAATTPPPGTTPLPVDRPSSTGRGPAR